MASAVALAEVLAGRNPGGSTNPVFTILGITAFCLIAAAILISRRKK